MEDSDHDEADTQMLLHIINTVQNSCKTDCINIDANSNGFLKTAFCNSKYINLERIWNGQGYKIV